MLHIFRWKSLFFLFGFEKIFLISNKKKLYNIFINLNPHFLSADAARDDIGHLINQNGTSDILLRYCVSRSIRSVLSTSRLSFMLLSSWINAAVSTCSREGSSPLNLKTTKPKPKSDVYHLWPYPRIKNVDFTSKHGHESNFDFDELDAVEKLAISTVQRCYFYQRLSLGNIRSIHGQIEIMEQFRTILGTNFGHFLMFFAKM